MVLSDRDCICVSYDDDVAQGGAPHNMVEVTFPCGRSQWDVKSWFGSSGSQS